MCDTEHKIDEAKKHFFLGLDCISNEQWVDAERELKKSLEYVPNRISTLTNLCATLIKLEKFHEVKELIDYGLSLDKNNPQMLLNQGLYYFKTNNYQQSLDFFNRSIDLLPGYPEAWSNRGNALKYLNRLEEALESYDRSIKLNPDLAESWTNRGIVLNNMKNHHEALASHDRSIKLNPDLAETWTNRGNVLLDLKRFKDAQASYEMSIGINPNLAVAWNNRGIALNELKLFDEALASYDISLELNPNYAEAWNNRGIVLNNIKQFEEAIASFDRAIELNSNYAEAQWSKSLSLLRLGFYKEGWKLYEWRWNNDRFFSQRRNFIQPLWLGLTSLNNKTILLHAEQGFGDAIQFYRYAHLVFNLGASVIIEAPKSLVTLFKSSSKLFMLISKGDDLPEFDFHCPFLSLPLAFKTETNSIPADIPYLYADVDKIQKWSNRIDVNDKIRIGINWSGNKNHKNDINRSIRFSEIINLLSDNFEWISLQKEYREEDLVEFLKSDVYDFAADLNDFSDTAALISGLDLIITVDSSVAHLAGALGKPTWVMLPHLPDFRWLLDREDSPWYPSIRLFRQPTPGDWSSVICDVKYSLFEL